MSRGAADGERAVRRAMSGDRAALDAIWRAHRRFVAAVLVSHWPRGLDPEDGIQEVALSLVRRISTLDDPAKLRPWLRSIAIHVAVSAARRARVAEAEPLGDADAADPSVARDAAR